jgi:hypothetical protein
MDKKLASGNLPWQWKIHESPLFIEGSLEVKLQTRWKDGKAEVGRAREEKRRRKKIREENEPAQRRCRRAKR